MLSAICKAAVENLSFGRIFLSGFRVYHLMLISVLISQVPPTRSDCRWSPPRSPFRIPNRGTPFPIFSFLSSSPPTSTSSEESRPEFPDLPVRDAAAAADDLGAPLAHAPGVAAVEELIAVAVPAPLASPRVPGLAAVRVADDAAGRRRPPPRRRQQRLEVPRARAVHAAGHDVSAGARTLLRGGGDGLYGWFS